MRHGILRYVFRYGTVYTDCTLIYSCVSENVSLALHDLFNMQALPDGSSPPSLPSYSSAVLGYLYVFFSLPLPPPLFLLLLPLLLSCLSLPYQFYVKHERGMIKSTLYSLLFIIYTRLDKLLVLMREGGENHRLCSPHTWKALLCQLLFSSIWSTFTN